MRPLDRLWLALDRLPTRAAVRSEWQALLGSDFPLVETLLIQTTEIASQIPRAGGHVWDVIHHDDGTMTGVDRESNERVPLSSKDLVVYALNIALMLQLIRDVYQLSPAGRTFAESSRLFYLGQSRTTKTLHPHFLSLPLHANDLLAAVDQIHRQKVASFVLHMPTPSFLTNELIHFLGCNDSKCVPLAGDITVDANGNWVRMSQERPSCAMEAPLSERSCDILIAMWELKAFDNDSRQKASAISHFAFGRNANPDSSKREFQKLVKTGFCQAFRASSQSGYWLSEIGRQRGQQLHESSAQTPG